MINLKTEEFVLDMTTLQSLQQLIQWVGDFVLYLLASLPNQVRAWGPERRKKKTCLQCSSSFSQVAHNTGVPIETGTWEKSIRKSRNTKWSFLCLSGHRWCSDWQLHSEKQAQ